MRIVFQLLLSCWAFVNRVASQPGGPLQRIADKIDEVSMKIQDLDTKIQGLSTTVNTLQNQVYNQVHFFHIQSMKIEITSLVSNTALLLGIEGSPWIADVCFSVVPSSAGLPASETVASNLVEVSKLSELCDFTEASRVAQHEVKLVESRYDGDQSNFDEGTDTHCLFQDYWQR